MSKKSGPLESAWHAALLVAGISLALWWAVQLLSSIYLWLLAGALVVTIIATVIWWQRRRSRW
jgi:hypothetical protein